MSARYLALLALALSGCATLEQGADRVVVVNDRAQVASCTIRGPVTFQGGTGNGQDLVQIRNQAAGYQADTVLIVRRGFLQTDGIAYSCGGAP
jgi:hypothetical protein